MSLPSSSSSSKTPRKYAKRTGKNIPVPPPASEQAVPATLETINSTRFQRTSSGYLGSSSKPITVSTPSCPEPQSSSPQVATAPPKSEIESSDSFAPLDPAYIESLDEGRVLKPQRQKYNPRPLFLSKRERILQEFLRLEGRGDYIGRGCANCLAESPAESPSFRCKQCAGGELFCKACIVTLHKRNPLHDIESWEHDSYFTRVSLRSLGLRIQLGHSSSEPCRNPSPTSRDGFIVLDVNGIHEAAVDFCECETAQPHFVQLLRYGWYPASVDRPHTAATMNLLKLFTLLNFESKASLFEFYNMLVQLTCNTGLAIPKDCYPVLGEMAREYKHIKSLKRAGRGHKPGGAAATSPGECAVLCPLCPQGDKNLEEKWEEKAQKAKHQYTLFLAIDANFRLKRRNVSSWDADPSFGDGWSYFVPSAIYQDHISTFDGVIVQSKSTCSNHKAVNDERSGKGLAATGVCTIDCARHDMKRPLSVGDLHRGERYVNVDHMFCSSLRNNQIKNIVSAYDVGCQWKVNFWQRNAQYPPELSLDPEAAEYRVLVPKFHLPAHISACQTKFSFNYAPGVGRTDGEACERGWSRINPIAMSTMEMGPGTRQDLIDAHFRYTGWKKYTIFDVMMLKATKEAVRMSGEFRFLHERYRDGLSPTLVERWEREVVAWEMDPENHPNPYEKKFKSISQEAVRKRLVAEDKAAESSGNAYVLHEGVSASTLITMGLNLEDEQRQIEAELNRSAKSELSEESAKLQNRVNILQRKITAWIKIQHLYVPLLHDIRVKDDEKIKPDQPETPVYSIPLYLPSSAPSSAECDKRLSTMEYDLRHAQAHDALDDVRNSLRLRSHVYQDKDRFQRGQRHNTRSLGLIARLDRKCSLAAGKYRAARSAVLSLAGYLKRVGVAEEFPELAPGDIRGLMDDSTPDHVKKSQAYPKLSKNLSWIWKKLGPDSPPEDENLQDDLRIEFCKSRALCNRWGEEVDILEVETERGLRFLARRSSEWTTLASLVEDTADRALFEGKRAYALEQAAQFGQMRARWAKSWRYIPDYVALGRETVVPLEVEEEEKRREDESMASKAVA